MNRTVLTHNNPIPSDILPSLPTGWHWIRRGPSNSRLGHFAEWVLGGPSDRTVGINSRNRKIIHLGDQVDAQDYARLIMALVIANNNGKTDGLGYTIAGDSE